MFLKFYEHVLPFLPDILQLNDSLGNVLNTNIGIHANSELPTTGLGEWSGRRFPLKI
jgi:hypothetical protein